jgi:hypothetical protein
MARDQQENAVSGGDRPLQPLIDRSPGLIEIPAVKVEDSIGLHGAGPQPPVPA